MHTVTVKQFHKITELYTRFKLPQVELHSLKIDDNSKNSIGLWTKPNNTGMYIVVLPDGSSHS